MDMARQQRVLANVAMIESRDREEREQLLRISTSPTTSEDDQGQRLGPFAAMNLPKEDNPSLHPPDSLARGPPNNHAKPGPRIDEPQTWTPRARGRGNA